jgi:hypothetical protein
MTAHTATSGGNGDMMPRTEYVLAEDRVRVAYQVFGEGGLDLVFANRMAATIGYMWEIPDFARFLRRLGTMARVIVLDPRGTGVGTTERRLGSAGEPVGERAGPT